MPNLIIYGSPNKHSFTMELLEKILKRQKGDDLGVLLNQQDKLFKQLQSCARELGMSVTARGKIIIPQPPEEADEL